MEDLHELLLKLERMICRLEHENARLARMVEQMRPFRCNNSKCTDRI